MVGSVSLGRVAGPRGECGTLARGAWGTLRRIDALSSPGAVWLRSH